MTALQAARVDDPIAHTASKSWMIVGLIGGAILGAATVATGGLALVVASAAVGACAAGGLGEVLGSMSWAPRHVTGMLTEGSPNVYVNSRKAIRAHLSLGKCDEHSGSPKRVAEGSIKIYINNYPAARLGDKLTCSAEIFAGSPNVFFGGAKVQTDEISPEIPGWVNWVMLGVGTAALAVVATPAIAVLSAAGALLGGTAGNWAGGWLFGEGSDGQKWSMLFGSLIGGGIGMKGGAKFDAVRAARLSAEPVTPDAAVSAINPVKPAMPLEEAMPGWGDAWIKNGREYAELRDPYLSSKLTDDQVGALYGYTTNEGYTMLNPALRGTEPMTPGLEAYSQHLSEAMDVLPPTSGTFVRGVRSLPPDVLDQHVPGNIVSDPGYFSTDMVKPFKGKIQMQVEGYSGKQIDFVSEFKDINLENEVLFKPNTKFEVIDRVESHGFIHIKLKEVQ